MVCVFSSRLGPGISNCGFGKKLKKLKQVVSSRLAFFHHGSGPVFSHSGFAKGKLRKVKKSGFITLCVFSSRLRRGISHCGFGEEWRKVEKSCFITVCVFSSRLGPRILSFWFWRKVEKSGEKWRKVVSSRFAFFHHGSGPVFSHSGFGGKWKK